MIQLILACRTNFRFLLPLYSGLLSVALLLTLSSTVWSKKLHVEYLDDTTYMIRFPLKLAEFEPEGSHRTRRSRSRWWTSLDHFTGSSCDGKPCFADELSGPGDIIIEDSGRVVFADQKRIYAFWESVGGKVIIPRSIKLPKSTHYVYRQRTHMTKTSNGSFISNNDTGIYLARFEEYGSDEVTQLKKHGSKYWKHSNDLATNNDAGLTWATEGTELLAFSHANQSIVHRFTYTDAKVSGRAAISALGDVVLVSASVCSGDQRKLEVSAFLSTAPESSRLLWRRQFKPVKKNSLKCQPEMALSDKHVYLLCNQDILVLDVHNKGKTKFRTRKRHETKPLKGLVIDKNQRFYTQGEKALYSFDSKFRPSVYNYPQSVTPAEGLLLVEDGTLIAPAVINNEALFGESPEFFSQSVSPDMGWLTNTNQTIPAPSTIATTVTQPDNSTQPVKTKQPEVKPVLRLHKFRVVDGTLSLISQEEMSLRSKFIPHYFKNDKTGRPFWTVGAPTLSDSGNLYLFTASISRKDCDVGGVPCTCYWVGTDMIVKHTINKGLDKTAMWAKKYQNSNNTNFLAYHGTPFTAATLSSSTYASTPVVVVSDALAGTAENHGGQTINKLSAAGWLITAYITARVAAY